MYIRVAADAVSLEEPEDTKRFKVVSAAAGTDVDAALRSAEYGRLDGSEALIDVSAVRRAATGRVDGSWSAEFDRMLDYAASKGWLTEDGAIRAHIEAAD